MAGIFKIIGIVFLIGLYCVYAIVCLRLTKLPTNIQTIAGFVIFGGLAGFASFIGIGAIISEGYGLHGEGYKVASMFALSGVTSTIVSVYVAKLIGGYQK